MQIEELVHDLERFVPYGFDVRKRIEEMNEQDEPSSFVSKELAKVIYWTTPAELLALAVAKKALDRAQPHKGNVDYTCCQFHKDLDFAYVVIKAMAISLDTGFSDRQSLSEDWLIDFGKRYNVAVPAELLS